MHHSSDFTPQLYAEDKAERKARKEQRKAEKALAKETVGEDAAVSRASISMILISDVCRLLLGSSS